MTRCIISYERHAYESVDDISLSYRLYLKNELKTEIKIRAQMC